MSDLYLTPYERNRLPETQTPKQTIKPFSEWTGEKDLSGDAPYNYLRYADYVRDTMGDSYDTQAEVEIQKGLREGLSTISGMDEETLEKTLTPEEPTFNQNVKMVYSALPEGPERQTLRDYIAGATTVSEQPDATDEYKADVEIMRTKAEAIMESRIDEAKQVLVNEGDLSFAFVKDDQSEDGKRLIVGDSAISTPLVRAIRSSRMGGVSFMDVPALQYQTTAHPYSNIPIFKHKQLMEISKGIEALAKSDSMVNEHLLGHARRRGRHDQTLIEKKAEQFGRGISRILNKVGIEDEYKGARRERVTRARYTNHDSIIEHITEQLNESGANYNPHDVRDAYENNVVQTGFQKGVFKLRQEDEEDFQQNIQITRLGPVVNPKAYLQNDVFEGVLKHPDLNESQKAVIKESRDIALTQNFQDYNRTLSNSDYKDEWSEELLAGRLAGKKDSQILTDFLTDNDTYSDVFARGESVRIGLVDSFASLYYLAVSKLGDEEFGHRGLVGIAEDQAERRKLAEMFGADWGVEQDIVEGAAPLVVDVVATGLLGVATGGAAGAAYLTARTGARLTLNGLIKGITSNALRATGTEALERVAKTAVSRGLIKESVETGGRKATIKALEAYNNTIAKKLGIQSALYTTASNRITSGAYGNMYSQLREAYPDMSDQEVRDKAMGYATSMGTVGGLITSAFSLMGRGAVDDALLKGMNFRQAKELIKSFGNVAGITDKSLAGAMKEVMEVTLKKHGKSLLKGARRGLKHGGDEAMEEGISELVNTYIEDVALEQETPLMERFQQVAGAAFVGGVFGMGVPAARAVASKLGVTPMDRVMQQVQLENQFYEDVAQKLKATGSSLSAKEIRNKVKERARTRPVEAPTKAQPPALPTPEEGKKDFVEVDNRPPDGVKEDQLSSTINTNELEQGPAAVEALLKAVRMIDPKEATIRFDGIQQRDRGKFSAQFEETTTIDMSDLSITPSEDSTTPFDVDLNLTEFGRRLRNVTEGPDTNTVVGHQTQRVVGHNAERRSSIPPNSKARAKRNASGFIEFDSEVGSTVQRKIFELASAGYPATVTRSISYGIPLPKGASEVALTEHAASYVYALYPTVKTKKTVAGSIFRSTSSRTRFNPRTGKTETGQVTGFLDERGIGQFDNDPIVTVEMLRAGIPVAVPNTVKNINPSIIVENGYVKDVVGPTPDGGALESKVDSVEKFATLYFDNSVAAMMRASVDSFKAVNLPKGVSKFDESNGAILEGSFGSTTEIVRAINKFGLELDGEGDGRNELAQSRFEASSGPLSVEGVAAAKDRADQQFLFNAYAFELRDALQNDSTDKVGKLLSRMNVKEATAAQRLLPFIKVEDVKELSNKQILETFIDQKVINNPDFSANSAPTYASVISKAAEETKSQEDYIIQRRESEAKASLPDSDLDTSSGRLNDFISNFGRKPDGSIADPASVAAMVSGAVDSAIDAINTDQKLRIAVDSIVSNGAFDGSPEVNEMVSSLKPSDLFGIFSSWAVSGNGRVRKSVKDFISSLESEEFSMGMSLRNALVAARFTTRPRGMALFNPPAVAEFQSLFSDITNVELTSDEARNTMIAIDGALRTRLSSANLTATQRQQIAFENEETIADLGLESGNADSVVTALEKVAKTDKNPNHKLVANLLLEDPSFIKSVKFVIGEGDADIAGKYVKTIDGNHTVFINRSTGNGRGLVNTLLEEYVHASVSDTVSRIDDLPRGNKKTAALKLKALFNKTDAAYRKSVADGVPPNPVIESGLANLDEFVAHFLLSGDFQKFIKTVQDPQTKFFSSIIESMVSVFRRVSGRELDQYTSAFKDILDLGRHTRKTTTTNAKALGASTANGALFSAPTKEAGEPEVVPTTEAEVEAEVLDTEGLPEGMFDNIDNSNRADLQSVAEFIRSLVPPSIAIKERRNEDGSLAGVSPDESAIFIDPVVLAEEIRGLSILAAKGVVGVKINEELAHTASFNALTQAEVDAYVDALSDADFDVIIREYTSNTPDPDFAQKFVAALASEDPQVVLNAKRALAEEKLRMYLQKATRGFTTEEDYRFWKSEPSLLALLKRYFSGAIRRFAFNRKQIGGAGGAALNKMIVEMRAIEVGFVRQPNFQAFDANNPEASFSSFVSMSNQDYARDAVNAAPTGEQTELDVTNIGADVKEAKAKAKEAAGRLKIGEITREEYNAIVDELLPLAEFDEVPVPATLEDIQRGLGNRPVSSQDPRLKKELIVEPESIPEGERIQSRLDIPSYDQQNVWVVSIHKDTGTQRTGPIQGYANSIVLRNVGFNIASEKAALNIATGKQKRTIATMVGDSVSMTSEAAYDYAQEAKASGEWVEVGMNPQRHSYFYVKETQEPVEAASEVIQVGGMVLAKVEGLKVAKKTDYLFSAPTGSIAHVYEKEQGKLDEMRKAGRVRVAQDIRQFSGFNVLFHQPDTAFAGEVTFDGETLVTGQGGVYYPLMFSDKNYFWASTRSAAVGMAETLNEIGKRNGGKVYMALTSADVSKLFSSTTMSTATMDFFGKLSEREGFYGLTKAQLNKILIGASEVTVTKKVKDKDDPEKTTETVQKFEGIELKIGSKFLGENIATMREALEPDNSVFPVRKAFVEAVASGVANVVKKPTGDEILEVKRTINRLSKEIQKLVEAGEDSSTLEGELKSALNSQKKQRKVTKQAMNISELLIKDNEYAKRDILSGKLAKASIMQGLGNMFTEPFLKTFQKLDGKDAAGNVYAILELDGEVKALETPKEDSHQSYPYTIVSTSNAEPKIHVLEKSYKWSDITRDIDSKMSIREAAAEYDIKIAEEKAVFAKSDAVVKAKAAGKKAPTFSSPSGLKDPRKVYFPTSGVSKNNLELVEPDEEAEKKSMPLLFSAPTGKAPLRTGLSTASYVDLLETSVFEVGNDKKPNNMFTKWVSKNLFGEVSEPVRRFIQYRSFFEKAVGDNVVKFKRELDKLIEETYGGFENAPLELIAQAQGYREGGYVGDEQLTKLDELYEKALDDISERRKSGDITADEARAEMGAAQKAHEDGIATAEDAGIKQAEEDRNKALAEIATVSPKLAAFIGEIRQKHIIPIQKKLLDGGLNKDVRLKIDRTGQVYLTRSYKMFTDATYFEMVKEDKDYANIRAAAIDLFEKQFTKDTARKLMESDDKPLTYQEALAIADKKMKKLSPNPNTGYGQVMLDEFLSNYDPSAGGSSSSTTAGMKMLMDNFARRKDLPKPIRALLGEHGMKDGTDLILRTYSTVSSIAAQQTFLENLRNFGTDPKVGLMVTAQTMFATEESRKKYEGFVPVRNTKAGRNNDPMSDIYVHRDFQKALDMTLKNSYTSEFADTAERTVNGALSIAAKASGGSMAFKTILSISHHVRNGLGNIFFATSQGYLRYDKLFVSMGGAAWKSLRGTNKEIDPVVSELIGLGVGGNDIRANIMYDLFTGKQTPEGIHRQLEELMDKAQITKTKKGFDFLMKKAQDLSAALDDGYKVVMYQHELSVLQRAAEADGPDGKLPSDPVELKRMAARKILMTAQSYSQAPPIVSEITKSPIGLLFSPFLRFKAEMFRIPFNTYKLGLEEIRSGNPVLRTRGIQRIAGMTSVLGVVSAAVPILFSALSGIGDDEHEEEAMRAGIPEYYRGNTFFMYMRGGKLRSADFTYVNPFAGVVDPILRSIEQIRQGNFSEAGAAFALGYLKDQFLDTQILAGAVINAAKNTDHSTGKPIWNRGADEPIDVASKLFGYVFSEAYTPRIWKDAVKMYDAGSPSGVGYAFLEAFRPFREHDVDFENQFQRYLLDHKKRYANVKSELGELRKNEVMDDADIREIIDKNIENRRKMNYELMRVTKGFSSLGVRNDKLISIMNDMKIGQNRIKLLSHNYMDRPSIKYILESLLSKEDPEMGINRADKIYDYTSTINRYLPVQPITENK